MKLPGGVLIALGILAVLVLTLALFGFPVGPSLRDLVSGSLGSTAGLSRTFVKAVPLILAGLGMVAAWRAGIYNIGGEGQLLVGALAAAAVAKGLLPALPGGLLNPVMLVASSLIGAAYAALAGWLQVARGVQAVISTILLNFVALELVKWAARVPLRRADGTLPQTDPLPDSVMLLRFSRQFDLHSGLIYALLVAIVLYVVLFHTAWGFRLRLVGANPRAARANGIEPGRVAIGAMALSGALCGLAGGIEYTGVTGLVSQGFSQGWGFLAIPVALLGGLHPLGVLASGSLFGALFAGSENLARFASGGDRLIYVIQALAVLAFVGFKAWEDRRPVPVAEEA